MILALGVSVMAQGLLSLLPNAESCHNLWAVDTGQQHTRLLRS